GAAGAGHYAECEHAESECVDFGSLQRQREQREGNALLRIVDTSGCSEARADGESWRDECRGDGESKQGATGRGAELSPAQCERGPERNGGAGGSGGAGFARREFQYSGHW